MYVSGRLSETQERLAKYNNEVCVGDGNVCIPPIIDEHSGKRIPLLTDGPKGREAIGLADASF